METGQHRRVLPRHRGRVLAVVIAFCTAATPIAIVLAVVFSIKAPSISVATASVSAFNVSGSSISSVWDIGFDVRDKNTEATASYVNVEAAVYYKEAKLSETSIQPFDQDSKNGTVVRTSLSAKAAHLDPAVINAMNRERAATGSVDFTVSLKAKINYRAPPWWYESISRHLDATCDKISIALPENSSHGTLAGGSKACVAHRGGGKVSGLGIVFILSVILVCSSGVAIIAALIWYFQRLEWH